MSSFLKSLFGTKNTMEKEEPAKEAERKFDILKYDGIKAIKIGKTGYAIRCFNEALKFREDSETLEYLASAYLKQGDSENAIASYDRLISIWPDHTEAYLQRAQLYLQENRENETIADCQHILKHSEDYRAYLLIALAQNTLSLYEEAVANLIKASEIREDIADIFLARSKAYHALKQYEKALEDINRAIQLAPEEESVYMQRAKIHESCNDCQAALEDYATVTELNPFHEQAYLESSRILMENQRIDEAIQYLDEALEIKPAFGRAYIARGEAKKLKGDIASAAEDIQTGQELCDETEEDEKHPVNFEDMYANRPL